MKPATEHRQCELLSCFDVDGVGHRRAGANPGTTRSQLNELLGSGSLTDSDHQSLLKFDQRAIFGRNPR